VTLSPLIEAYTHCPLCGSGHFVAASPGRRCDDCGHREFNNPVAAAGAFISDDHGRLLLIRRANEPARGALMIPGGFLDGGESLEDAARREVREEVGLEILDLTYLTSHTNQYLFDGLHRVTVDVMFAATVASLDVVLDSDEATGFEFFGADEVDPAELAFDSIRAGCAAWRAERAQRHYGPLPVALPKPDASSPG